MLSIHQTREYHLLSPVSLSAQTFTIKSFIFVEKGHMMTDDTQEQQITAAGNEMSARFLAAKNGADEPLADLAE